MKGICELRTTEISSLYFKAHIKTPDRLNSGIKSLHRPTTFRKFEKTILEKVMRPCVQWYISKPRKYRYQNINVNVDVGVFHPGIFFSTKALLSSLDTPLLKNKSVMELGAGTGLLSIYSASHGAHVLATDINPQAIKNIKENIELNQQVIDKNSGSVRVVLSDLFKELVPQKFDYILINPPYYKGEARNPADRAWYCGPKLEFFSDLFSGIRDFTHEQSEVLMIISEDVELEEIETLATQNNYELILHQRKKNILESNFIYKLYPTEYKRAANS
jgi:release factor glutamine methyltransferase